MAAIHVRDVGDFIREQRRGAQISLRQLARQAGVSNPYLSQIERGLRRPSAEILQQIAKALRISAEVLYVQAGILEEREGGEDLLAAVHADETLTERQKQVIVDIYDAFRRENALAGLTPGARGPAAAGSGDTEADVEAGTATDALTDIDIEPDSAAPAPRSAASASGSAASPSGTDRAASAAEHGATTPGGKAPGEAGPGPAGRTRPATTRRKTAATAGEPTSTTRHAATRKAGDGRRGPRSSSTKSAPVAPEDGAGEATTTRTPPAGPSNT
ncbi:helix-turn-helix domain-containing protein [Frankia sp. Mgl5]|uniref:helix-turn-helix domain-containing protein n=1 Tax=Frankia sp. Mgl5 TaxID=2933793 RepID=UPI00201092AC|nr:helix-turn-helix transcriptional regulator [Frankia sp. Mgl5]MCK9925639.1 helix-turn-helix domain-containing protein [Frankia sp. Mgl5]